MNFLSYNDRYCHLPKPGAAARQHPIPPPPTPLGYASGQNIAFSFRISLFMKDVQ